MARTKTSAATAGAEPVPVNDIAPPAGETIRADQDGAGEADSGVPAAIEPASPPQAPTADPDERRGHSALMDLDLDGVSYSPLETVFVTQDEFNGLKAAAVFEGEWDEGLADGEG